MSLKDVKTVTCDGQVFFDPIGQSTEALRAWQLRVQKQNDYWHGVIEPLGVKQENSRR